MEGARQLGKRQRGGPNKPRKKALPKKLKRIYEIRQKDDTERKKVRFRLKKEAPPRGVCSTFHFTFRLPHLLTLLPVLNVLHKKRKRTAKLKMRVKKKLKTRKRKTKSDPVSSLLVNFQNCLFPVTLFKVFFLPPIFHSPKCFVLTCRTRDK